MINNNIEESYCSFEVSKLLFRKGFDAGTAKTAYSENGNNKISPYSSAYTPYKYPILDCTHSLAISWIEENFNIYIKPHCSLHSVPKWWDWSIETMSGDYQSGNSESYETKEECVNAVLLYTLQNLIT